MHATAVQACRLCSCLCLRLWLSATPGDRTPLLGSAETVLRGLYGPAFWHTLQAFHFELAQHCSLLPALPGVRVTNATTGKQVSNFIMPSHAAKPEGAATSAALCVAQDDQSIGTNCHASITGIPMFSMTPQLEVRF